MAVLYVASDEPRAGKTSMCATLATAFRHGGKTAAAFKPLTRAQEPGRDSDAGTYRDLLGQHLDGWPVSLSESGVSPALLEKVTAAATSAAEGVDVLIVEAPAWDSDEDSVKLAESLDAQVLFVGSYRPGMAASEVAEPARRYGDRLLGLMINRLARYQNKDGRNGLLSSLEAKGVTALGALPEDRTLLGVTVGEVAATLDGRFIMGEELADGLVEHFLVGGLGLDSGVLYFGLRENKAVIVRGDRPDIQMAALQTPTTCMVLTGGTEPIEYVLNEAEAEEVPLIVVDIDTLGTMESLGTVMDGASFNHPRKLARFEQVLTANVDLETLTAGLGLST